MAIEVRKTIGIVVATVMATAFPVVTMADPVPSVNIEVPIIQTIMRDGVVRYSVWLSVGDRFVEAMLDTGSIGLRVLPAVVPGDLTGLPTEANYGSGVSLGGLVIARRVEIGSLSASVPIEVVDHAACQPNRACPVPKHGDEYLIAGDGASGHGYSAILGIGFTSRTPDIPNPLEVLGAPQWIVELPRPEEPDKPGRLILRPDVTIQSQFSMAPVSKRGDFFGCLRSKKPEQNVCGTVLLDSGAPVIMVVPEEGDTSTVWPVGTASAFRFPGKLTLEFTSTMEIGKVTSVFVVPAKQSHMGDAPFILAGVYPYFFYDVLYDASSQKVGLKVREKPVPAQTIVASTEPATSASSEALGAAPAKGEVAAKSRSRTRKPSR